MTFSASGSTTSPTLVDVFYCNNEAQVNAPAIYIPCSSQSSRFTYRRYHEICAQLADILKRTLNLSRGDIVITVLPNGLACTASFLACAGLGWTVAPLNPAYNAEEIRFYIEDTGSRVMIVPAGWSQNGAPAIQAATRLGCRILEVEEELATNDTTAAVGLSLVEVLTDGTSKPLTTSTNLRPEQVWLAQPDDVALVLHTSGTTGRPKCE
jgi:acyl-coenzyme A synthetase/AMP-(fatty) acid ligase